MPLSLCGSCGAYARNPRSPDPELRRRDCPRFGVVHRGCCRLLECSRVDARGAVRCDFAAWTKAREAAARRGETPAGRAATPL